MELLIIVLGFSMVTLFWIIIGVSTTAVVMYGRIKKEETGVLPLSSMRIKEGLHVIFHLFRNPYKNRKGYNTLIWVLRIACPLLIIVIILLSRLTTQKILRERVKKILLLI